MYDTETGSRSKLPNPAATSSNSEPGKPSARSELKGRLRPYLSDMLLVAVPIVFGLILLARERLPVPYLNDSAMHLQMVRWAETMIKAGHLPLDGWYPNLQLGTAHFIHYQSLPHVLTGYLATAFGADGAFRWTLYLLLALWPISVYVTARLFSLGRLPAVIAAVLSPLLASATSLGFEWSSYVWRGSGVWAQLWGMMTVGPALALSWRAVRGRGSIAAASALLALTVAFHFLTGYLAFAGVAIWVVARPSELLKRIPRAILVTAGGLLGASWVLFPLFRDSKWIARTIYNKGISDLDSFGAKRVIGWLVSGEIFDARRLPVITLLLAAGLVVAVVRFRRDEAARCILGLFLFSLVLFCGRPTFGPLLKILPGSRDLLFSRFISGVHLSGLLLAGMGGAVIVRWLAGVIRLLIPAVPRMIAPALVLLSILVLSPAWRERVAYIDQGNTWTRQQLAAERTDGADVDALIKQAKKLGGGRIYGGSRGDWGLRYRVKFVPIYARIARLDADGVGFTLRTGGLSSDIETDFDETNPNDYDLLNIKYLVFPAGRTPGAPATKIAARGRHVLWKVQTSGYLEVVDTTTPIEESASDILQPSIPFLNSSLGARRLYPTVAFAGAKAQKPTSKPGVVYSDAPGSVVDQFDAGMSGSYGGQIQATRESVVILKSSFDPHWTATIDGVPAKTFMVAPSFVGVEVTPGRHSVSFKYRSATNYLLLFLVSAGSLLGLSIAGRRGILRRVGEGD